MVESATAKHEQRVILCNVVKEAVLSLELAITKRRNKKRKRGVCFVNKM